MEEIRRSLIATIMGHVEASPGTQQYKAQCRKNLEGMSIDQLNEALAKIVHENAQVIAQSQAILDEIRAQRHAEATLFDLQVNAPKREAAQKAQVDKDVATFAQAARETRTVGVSEANFHMVLSALGHDFTLEACKAFIETNGSTLMSAPTVHERNAWKYQDDQDRKAAIAQQNEYKKNLPDEQLRALVRQEGQQSHAAAQQAHAQQQVQAMEQKCNGQFPPIPLHNASGEAMDSAYFIRISNAVHGSEQYNLFRRLIKKHGFANVTARLQGVR